MIRSGQRRGAAGIRAAICSAAKRTLPSRGDNRSAINKWAHARPGCPDLNRAWAD